MTKIDVITAEKLHVFYCGKRTVVQGVGPCKGVNMERLYSNCANKLDNDQARYGV